MHEEKDVFISYSQWRHCARLPPAGHGTHGERPQELRRQSWHQAHDAKTLFIVDGSSLTTSVAFNLTSTIGALALRRRYLGAPPGVGLMRERESRFCNAYVASISRRSGLFGAFV
jgi:hypothetical protein